MSNVTGTYYLFMIDHEHRAHQNLQDLRLGVISKVFDLPPSTEHETVDVIYLLVLSSISTGARIGPEMF